MLKTAVRTGLRRLGYQLVRLPKMGSRYAKNMAYESDDGFHRIRLRGVERTGIAQDAVRSIEKLYNTTEMFKATRGLDGAIAECGCFKGLSSYVFCHMAREVRPDFDGANYFIFDSFEGLSAPGPEDRILDAKAGDVGSTARDEGAFAAGLDEVKRVLSEFPAITYVKGWIPNSFEGVPERKYRFVHIDVDLYEPTLGALEYFFPRLTHHGVIVCDDYAHLHWPGARRAFDEYCRPRGIPIVALTTGQGVICRSLAAAQG